MGKARWIAIALLTLLPAQALAAADKPAKPAAGATDKKKKKPKKKKQETPAQEAKRRRDAGTKAYKARKYETAVTELEQAYKLEPQPGPLLMLGDSYFQLKDFLAAYEAYDRALTDHAGDLKASQKADAEKAIRQLEALTSQIEVMVDERDAMIAIDGKSVGKSPMKSPVRVSAAKHRVRVTAGSFEPIEQEIEPKPGERLVVPIRFVPDGSSGDSPGATGPAKLKITASPAEATVEIDGKEVGTGGYEGSLTAGKHKLVVRAQGFESFVQELDLSSGEATSRDVQLEKEGGGKDDAPAAPKASSSGLYANVTAVGVLPIAGQVRQPTPDPEATSSAGMALGGGGALRGGYAFGALGIEIVGAFVYERHAEKQNIPGKNDINDPDYQAGNIARIENFGFSSLSIFGGAGPRLTTQGSSVRFTVGTAGGLWYRSFTARREVGGAIQDSYRAGASSASPALAADLGLLIGSTPGLKFVIGAFAMVGFGGSVATPTGDPRVVPVEFDGQTVDATLPTPAYSVARGVQVFVGPQLGLQFGH